MAKEIRIRCPLCGMLPELWRIRKRMAKAEARTQVMLMTIGGRRKGEYKTDKKGKYRLVVEGIIDYEDKTAENQALLRELKPDILNQIEKIKSLMESIT